MQHSNTNTLLITVIICILAACQGPSTEAGTDTGNGPELQQSGDTAGVNQQKEQIRIMPGHIVMMVSDLNRSQQFYEERLKFHTNEEVMYDGLRRIFMSASENHHELVLLESRVDQFPHIDQRQLQQVAFEVPSHKILVEYYQHIKQTGIPFVIKDNQVSLSLYFPDPDNVTVEIYWDISDQPFGEKMWNGNQENISEEKFLNPFDKMEK